MPVPGPRPRQQVLQYLAQHATTFGVFGEEEEAQPSDAITCAWASLESIVFAFHGAEALRGQLEHVRQLVIANYVIPHGSEPEKPIAGVET